MQEIKILRGQDALLVKWYNAGFVTQHRLFDSVTGHQNICASGGMADTAVLEAVACNGRESSSLSLRTRFAVVAELVDAQA